MNSKKCLEKLYDACDKDLLYEQCGLLGAYKLFEVIKQDLDRLEKLEKAIKIINKKIYIVKLGTYFMTFTEGNYEETELTQEEYELLKEILEND